MLLDDSEFKRKIFFYCYMISTLFQYIYGVNSAFTKVDQEEPWKQACDDINKKGELGNIHASNLAECHETIMNMIHTSMVIFFILLGILNVHFFSVVYTHWRNH